MRIGNRSFPYPVVNKNQSLSGFKSSFFHLEINPKTDNPSVDPASGLVIHGISFATNSDFLKTLIKSGKAAVVLLIECSDTLFRRSYPLSEQPQDITVPASSLSGRTDCSAFVYLKENTDEYCDSDFLEDYESLSFSLEKGDIIAADDGFSVNVILDKTQSDYVPSFVSVVKKLDDPSENIDVSLGKTKISIGVCPEQFDKYYGSKDIVLMQPFYFSILLVPALAQALYQLQKESANGGFDGLSLKYDWFLSLSKAYANANNGTKLDETELANLEPFLAAQKLLNLPITKAIDDIWGAVNSARKDEDEQH